MMFGFQDNDEGEVLFGAEAHLEDLRTCMKTGNVDAQMSCLKQMLDDAKEEKVLTKFAATTGTVMGLEESTGVRGKNFSDIPGFTFVTTERLFFVAKDDNLGDVSVNAASISLHAISSDPKSIYVQIDGPADDSSPMELVLVPHTDIDQACNQMFQQISAMISLHPIDPNDGEFDDCEGDDDDNMVFTSAALGAWDDGQDDAGATPEERAAMLERLDNLLVVKPEFELEGQFDDADEETSRQLQEQGVEGQFDDPADEVDQFL